MAIVTALSDVIDEDPAELEPLQQSVDMDALDALIRVRNTQSGDSRVSLTLGGHMVTIHSYGVVTVVPAGADQTAGQSEKVHHT